ncbi:MAG: hypothetical protein ACFNXZ_02885, partial [Lautropia mirabilis]
GAPTPLTLRTGDPDVEVSVLNVVDGVTHDRPSGQDHGHDADILADWLQAHGLALVDQPTTMIRLATSRPDADTPAGNGPQNAPQARTATVCALAAQALG